MDVVRGLSVRRARWILLTAMTLPFVAARGSDNGNAMAQPELTPRTAAQFDLTGYWVSVINKDWVYRMITQDKGDRGTVPLNANGLKAANDWDPTKGAADGEQCKAYGAGGVMRLPSRLHISWKDDSTLKIDLDAGMQTRLLHFADFLPPSGFGASEAPISLLRFQAPPGAATRQGYSIAAWQKVVQIRGLQIVISTSTPPPTPAQGGSLMVMTVQMKPGYLQRNGIPYSSDAVLTEYFNRIHLPNGEDYLILTSIVDDPVYLNEPYVTGTEFKRERDGAKWTPSPCGAD